MEIYFAFNVVDCRLVVLVVIKKSHRGKGYGGKLMRETEEHARK